MADTCRASHADMNADCEAAVARRLPILLTGPRNTTGNWIHHIQHRLALPVIEVACDAGVKTTALAHAGTVILHDVEQLRRGDQQRLLRWLEKAPHRPQIISTSSRELCPLVGAGGFSESLYYRLNSVHLDCRNPTIIDLGLSSDEGGWIGEFPAEERLQSGLPLPVPSVLAALRSGGRARLALASCALGVVIGAVSMWVVTAQSRVSIVPGASGARIQEAREQSAQPRQYDVPAATLQNASARSVPPPRATTGQSEPAPGAVAPTLQRPAGQLRRTVFRGALAVNSRPTGARVAINGKPFGVTPLRVNSLPAGSRVVRLTAQGYHPWASAVRVVANQRNSVIVTLQRLPD